MKHQPFRRWLISEEPLSVEQSQALRDHLSSCESCNEIETAWKELELVIRRTPDVDPAPGFPERWQSHLLEYQSHRQARRGWLTISLTALVVASLLVVLIAQLWSLYQAPGPFLADWLTRLVSVASFYYTLQNFVSSYSWYDPLYTFIGMFFLVGMISFMSVLWLATYRKFSMARRVA